MKRRFFWGIPLHQSIVTLVLISFVTAPLVVLSGCGNKQSSKTSTDMPTWTPGGTPPAGVSTTGEDCPAGGDADGDGLCDDAEVGMGLDPTNPDEDGDGVLDGMSAPYEDGGGPGGHNHKDGWLERNWEKYFEHRSPLSMAFNGLLLIALGSFAYNAFTNLATDECQTELGIAMKQYCFVNVDWVNAKLWSFSPPGQKPTSGGGGTATKELEPNIMMGLKVQFTVEEDFWWSYGFGTLVGGDNDLKGEGTYWIPMYIDPKLGTFPEVSGAQLDRTGLFWAKGDDILGTGMQSLYKGDGCEGSQLKYNGGGMAATVRGGEGAGSTETFCASQSGFNDFEMPFEDDVILRAEFQKNGTWDETGLFFRPLDGSVLKIPSQYAKIEGGGGEAPIADGAWWKPLVE